MDAITAERRKKEIRERIAAQGAKIGRDVTRVANTAVRAALKGRSVGGKRGSKKPKANKVEKLKKQLAAAQAREAKKAAKPKKEKKPRAKKEPKTKAPRKPRAAKVSSGNMRIG